MNDGSCSKIKFNNKNNNNNYGPKAKTIRLTVQSTSATSENNVIVTHKKLLEFQKSARFTCLFVAKHIQAEAGMR